MKPQTWNDVLGAMIAVRDAHGWTDRADWRLHRGCSGMPSREGIRGAELVSAKQPLNVGLVGYGFMGRAHSNAFAKVEQLLRPASTSRC